MSWLFNTIKTDYPGVHPAFVNNRFSSLPSTGKSKELWGICIW